MSASENDPRRFSNPDHRRDSVENDRILYLVQTLARRLATGARCPWPDRPVPLALSTPSLVTGVAGRGFWAWATGLVGWGGGPWVMGLGREGRRPELLGEPETKTAAPVAVPRR